MLSDPMRIRDALPSDFARILELNEESVRFLSPLVPARLEQLHAEAAYHRILEADGEIAAFLLALQPGCRYDSPNYRWFAARFDHFIYIDRVVVSLSRQGRGIGRCLYEDLLSFARQRGFARVACEFDVEPLNEASRLLHAGFGFTEVGTGWNAAGDKRVSFQVLSLEPP